MEDRPLYHLPSEFLITYVFGSLFAHFRFLQLAQGEIIVILWPAFDLDPRTMHPPLTPVPDIGFDSTNEEIFISLEKMASGYPLPNNVIADVNPFNYDPSYLPEGIWYLIRSKDDGTSGMGSWRVEGEACKLFSNSAITGWMTLYVFFKEPGPNEHKTDWLMQEYWVSQKGPGENSKDATSLCRVFRGGGPGLNHQKQQNAGDAHIHLTELIVPNANSSNIYDSTRENSVDKNDETRVLAVTGELPDYLMENPPEMDYISRGDYLELLDLDNNPASRSSSSDNSSCLTMSSDEYCDSLVLPGEINSRRNRDLMQKNDNIKLSISVSLRINEVVMVPESPGVFTGHEEESRPLAEEIPGTDASRGAAGDNNRNRKADHRDEGPSGCNEASTSSGEDQRSQDGERKANRGRKKRAKKNKYMCFMPFYFLF